MAIPFPPGSKSFDERAVRAWAQQLLTGTGLYFKTITADSGSAVADQLDDELGILGGDGLITTVSADNITVSFDITSLSSVEIVDVATDLILVYDASSSAYKSSTFQAVGAPKISTNPRTAAYTAVPSDLHKLISYSGAGGVSLSLSTAAELGDGWHCWIKNSSAGTITIDPNGAETVDGAGTYLLLTTLGVHLFCDGAAFYVI